LPKEIGSLPKVIPDYEICKKRLSKLLIPFSQMNEAIEDIADIQRSGKSAANKRARESRGLCIVGEPRSGKSELIDIYAKDIAPDPDRILVVGFPSTSTHRQFTVSVLQALGDAYPSEGKTEERLNRCLKRMEERNIELLILDEAQHLLNSSANPEGHQRGADWLKEFLDKSGVPFVLSGPPRMLNIFKHQKELEGRISAFIEYRPLSWDDKAKRKEFIYVIQACESVLPFSHSANLSDSETAVRIFNETDGKIGLIKRLIGRAAQLAIRAGRPAITHEDIEGAVRSTKVEGNQHNG